MKNKINKVKKIVLSSVEIAKEKLHERRHRLFNAFFFAILFMLLPSGIESMTRVFTNNFPTSYWFTYDRIELVEGTNIAGERPKFISHALIKRQITIEWNDILRCRDHNGEYLVSSYVSSYTYFEKTKLPRHTINQNGDIVESSWQYGYKLPDAPGETCTLMSIITGFLPNGTQKTLVIEGPTFEIENF